jgi:DNA-binding CsgD family transcriptional regulator
MKQRPLTAREIEVLALTADGLANHEIAARLGVSVHTVVSHHYSIRGAMPARDRTHAVAQALRRGLIK